MRCDEVRTFHGAWLDSELDTKTTLEIEQHLAVCPACAGFFAEEGKLEARIAAGLKRGPRTAALWERIESEVAAASSNSLTRPPAPVSESAGWPAVLAAWSARFRAGWQTSRRAWAGLAMVWVAILALNFTAREPDSPLVAGHDIPSASEIRFALRQKQLLMADLAITSQPAPARKPKPAPQGPRSERRIGALNA